MHPVLEMQRTPPPHHPLPHPTGRTSRSVLGTNAGFSMTGPWLLSLSSSELYSELSSETCQ